ncbi:MAG: PAS-domain containing protein, partial [Alphaproteobacteria bacterium]|nr:PAS-domain containing protein [Alphaproteobacteria bacterium]
MIEFGRRLLGKDGSPEAGPDLAEALRDLPHGFALFDPQDRLVICNPGFREVFEVGDDPIPDGSKYAVIFRGAAVKGKIEGIRRDEEGWLAERLEAHDLAQNVFKLTLRNGRTYAASERRLTHGETVLALVDVTDYERRDAASRTNEQKARAMLDSVFDGVLTIGADGVVDSVNARAAEIFGRSIEAIIGSSVAVLIPDVLLADLIGDDALGNIREIRGRGREGAFLNLE